MAAALLLLLPLPSLAQSSSGLPFGLIVSEQARTSFTLVGAGARAAGMGGAFTAVADDATAASFNPAGLAHLVTPEVSAVLDWGRHSDDYTNFQSYDQVPVLPLTDSSIDFTKSGFNFASATLPFRLFQKRWAIQLSTQRLIDFTYSGSRKFSETSPDGRPLFHLEQDSEQSGEIRLYSASLAVQLTERTLLGVTVNRWDGSWDFASHNSEVAAVPGAETEYFTYSQKNKLKGLNADLGLLLEYPKFSIGVRYRMPFDADYNFSASLTTNISTSLQPLPPSETKLHWPGTLNAGLVFRPLDNFQMALDWGQTDWSEMLFDSATTGHVNFFDLQPPETTGATVANDWHFGAEYLFFSGQTVIPVRLGAFSEPEPSRDPTTGERLVQNGLTAGAGVKHRWFAMDLAIRYGQASGKVSRFLEADEIATGNLRATSVGDLTRKNLSLFLSFIFQVPQGSTASGILHEIFVGPSKNP
ncbi:MAG: hypothetical protein IT186_04680 [Acidobacteria bacterium]|nr:hypothetical protein [Acidobacteriota bacterium]